MALTVTLPPRNVVGTKAPAYTNPPKPPPVLGIIRLVPGVRAFNVRLNRSIVVPAGIGPANGVVNEIIPTPPLDVVNPGVTGKGRVPKSEPGTVVAAVDMSSAVTGAVPAIVPATRIPPGNPSTAPELLKSAANAKRSNKLLPSPVKTISNVNEDPAMTFRVVCIPGVVGSKSTEITGIADALVAPPNSNTAASA